MSEWLMTDWLAEWQVLLEKWKTQAISSDWLRNDWLRNDWLE